MHPYISPARNPRASSLAHPTSRRRGNTIVLVAACLPVFFGVAALTVDAGYLYLVRQELQTSADAAVLAAVWTYVDDDGDVVPVTATIQANLFANLNAEEASAQLEFFWSDDLFDLASPLVPAQPDAANAIRVTVTRSVQGGNPVELFFAGIFGQTQTDISASAVAALTPASGLDGVPIALAVPG